MNEKNYFVLNMYILYSPKIGRQHSPSRTHPDPEVLGWRFHDISALSSASLCYMIFCVRAALACTLLLFGECLSYACTSKKNNRKMWQRGLLYHELAALLFCCCFCCCCCCCDTQHYIGIPLLVVQRPMGYDLYLSQEVLRRDVLEPCAVCLLIATCAGH